MRLAVAVVFAMAIALAVGARASDEHVDADELIDVPIVTVADNHRNDRPSGGLVKAEMVDAPSTSVLHPSAVAETHFLSAGIAASPTVAQLRAAEDDYFTPESSFLLMTETERAAAMQHSAVAVDADSADQVEAEAEADSESEVDADPAATPAVPAAAAPAATAAPGAVPAAAAAKPAAVVKPPAKPEFKPPETSNDGGASGPGPRKYLRFASMNNLGSAVKRWKGQNARGCLSLCGLDARCVGFSVGLPGSSADGSCVLRGSWGAGVENDNYDSYQGVDMNVVPLPFRGGLNLEVKTGRNQRLFAIADVSRIRPKRAYQHLEVVLSVDGDMPQSAWSNVAEQYKEPEAHRHASFSLLSTDLPKGLHTVRLQVVRDSQADPVQGDDVGGKQSNRLTVVALPVMLSPTKYVDAVSSTWNPGLTTSTSSVAYNKLPGQRMLIKVPTQASTRLFVMGDLSRVQHSHGWTNSAFRLLVDGREIGYTNTGEHYGFGYRAVSLRAVSQELKAGEHTVEVQAKTQHGKLFFTSNGNGYQQRRLTALVVPSDLIWNRNWNLGTTWLKAQGWADIPGEPMTLTLTTPSPGYLLMNVGISRVQSWGTDNTEVRLLLDEVEVARVSMGITAGWRFSAASFHGVSKGVLQPGEHTLRVQFKSRAGSTVVFYNDGNGFQQRRLSAVLFPASAGLKSILQVGELDK